MNAKILLLSISILWLSFSSFAQMQNQPQKRNYKMSAPTKGYYSIGNNASKLYNPSIPSGSGLKLKKARVSPQVTKGYYATGTNATRLPGQVVLEEVNPSAKSSVITKPTKGYYSIGRNAEKLYEN